MNKDIRSIATMVVVMCAAIIAVTFMASATPDDKTCLKAMGHQPPTPDWRTQVHAPGESTLCKMAEHVEDRRHDHH